jgi:hypothetical protein
LSSAKRLSPAKRVTKRRRNEYSASFAQPEPVTGIYATIYR